MENTVQILESYWKEHPAWFGRSYGEYLHLGANQEMLRRMLLGVELSEEMRVLDLGCALGGNGRWLASLYHCKVDGIDGFRPAVLAARQLSKAQGVGSLCTFTVGEVDALPFSDSRFHLVLTAEDEVEWKEVARVMKPGAAAVGSTVASMGLASLESALKKAGLEVEELIDVTEYAQAFYRAKEEEAKLLVTAGMMTAQEMLSLQMHTVDLYDAGAASHVLFRAKR